MGFGGAHEIDWREPAVVATLVDVRDHHLEPLVDDGVGAVVHDEQVHADVGRFRECSAEQPPAPVTREDKGMQARIGGPCANPQPKSAAHSRTVMHRVERHRLVRPLRHVLAVLVGGADVVEADAVRPPRAVQLAVEIDGVDAPFAHCARDGPGVQVSRRMDPRALSQLALEPRQHLLEGAFDVAAHHPVVALHPVPEVAVLVAVRRVPGGEVPDVPGGDRAEVQRVLARVEAQADHDVVSGHAPPQLHRLVVATEGDVTVAIRVVPRDGVGSVDRPDSGRAEQLRQLGGELGDAWATRRLGADIDDDPAPLRQSRKLVDETVGVDLVEASRPLERRHVDLHLLRQDVGVERYGDGLGVGEDRLRLLELCLQPGDVVDDDAAIAQFGAQLGNHVHAML